MVPPFSIDDVLECFGNEKLTNRALEYWEHHHIISKDQQTDWIQAEVLGSGGQKYHVKIDWSMCNKMPHLNQRIDGFTNQWLGKAFFSCTCPYPKKHCKHSLAVLFEVLASPICKSGAPGGVDGADFLKVLHQDLYQPPVPFSGSSPQESYSLEFHLIPNSHKSPLFHCYSWRIVPKLRYHRLDGKPGRVMNYSGKIPIRPLNFQENTIFRMLETQGNQISLLGTFVSHGHILEQIPLFPGGEIKYSNGIDQLVDDKPFHLKKEKDLHLFFDPCKQTDGHWFYLPVISLDPGDLTPGIDRSRSTNLFYDIDPPHWIFIDPSLKVLVPVLWNFGLTAFLFRLSEIPTTFTLEQCDDLITILTPMTSMIIHPPPPPPTILCVTPKITLDIEYSDLGMKEITTEPRESCFSIKGSIDYKNTSQYNRRNNVLTTRNLAEETKILHTINTKLQGTKSPNDIPADLQRLFHGTTLGVSICENFPTFLQNRISPLLELDMEITLNTMKINPIRTTRTLRIDHRENWFDIYPGIMRLGAYIPVEIQECLLGYKKIDGEILILSPDIISAIINNSCGQSIHRNQLFDQWMLANTMEKSGMSVPQEFLQAREKISALFEAAQNQEILPTPKGLNGVLRTYQSKGFSRMFRVTKAGFGTCLADDMGLGKTIQALTFLLKLSEEHQKNNQGSFLVLIIAPVSTLGNWQDEIQKFCPGLKTGIHHGSDRFRSSSEFQNSRIWITSFPTIRSDGAFLAEVPWTATIIDESQWVKNHRTKTYKTIQKIHAPYRVALSGTPIENSLEELWALMDLLNPGLFGTRRSFLSRYNRKDDTDALRKLKTHTSPLIHQRKKEEVAPDLPPKTVIIRYNTMHPLQASIYQELADSFRAQIQDAINRGAYSEVGVLMLEGLLRLRQMAVLPGLFQKKPLPSGKIDLIQDDLADAIIGGYKVIVFSQFLLVLETLQNFVTQMGYRSGILTGQTNRNDRMQAISEFQNNPDSRVFFLSLRAGGTGINLTAADYVFLVDPWWNPAVEAQAIDRAHRIGQHKKVMACRFITRNTIEEKILNLQAIKKDIADGVLLNQESLLKSLTPEEILDLFS